MGQHKPPTSEGHIQMFMASVQDYERLEGVYPLGVSMPFLGHGSDDERRWQVYLHGMLLRKYFAVNDNLYLGTVMKAVRACSVSDQIAPDAWDLMVMNAGLVEGGFLTKFGDDPKTYTSTELHMRALYGRFLHGDYRDWKTTILAGDDGSDAAVFVVTGGRASRVRQLASFISQGIEEGHVVIDLHPTDGT